MAYFVPVGNVEPMTPGGLLRTDGFFRNAAILGVAELFVRFKSLIVIPLLTHHFGTINYGAWTQVTVIVGMAGPLATLATENAAIRYLPGAGDKNRRQWFLGWVAGLALMSALIGAILVIARQSVSQLVFGDAAHESLVLVAALSLVTTVMFTSGLTWLRASDKARRLAVITVLDAGWNIVAAALTVLTHRGPAFLILTMIAGDIVLTLYMIGTSVTGSHRIRPDFSQLARFARFSLPLLPSAFAVFGLNFLDRLFLVHYQSLAVVGAYSLAYSLGTLGIQTLAAPVSVMFPSAAAALWEEGSRAELQRLFNRSSSYIFLIIIPTIAGSAILGTSVIRILAPASFVTAALVIPVVMAGYLFSIISHYYEVALGLIHRQIVSTVAIIIALVINIALNIWLIPTIGMLGAAIATAVAFLAQLIVTFAVATAAGLLRTDWWYAVRVCTAAAIMTAVLSRLTAFFAESDGILLAVLIPVGIIFFAVAALAVRILDFSVLRGFIRTLLQFNDA